MGIAAPGRRRCSFRHALPPNRRGAPVSRSRNDGHSLESHLKKHPWSVYLVGSILLAVLAWVVDTRVLFQWRVFLDQLLYVQGSHIVLAAAMVVFCCWLRSVRWAVLLKPQKK